jgi:signal transduction histidine kinase/DNA-binding response OmpR family regulator
MKQKQTGNSSIISPERLQDIVSHFSDTIGISTRTFQEIQEPSKTITDDTEPDKKEGFFKRMWGSLSGNKSKPDTLTKVNPDKVEKRDTIHSYTKMNDTAIFQIKEQLKKMSEQEQIERQLDIERELMLLRTDQRILDEIRNVLLLFEKEEINKAIAEAENSKNILGKLWNTALIAAITGFITMLIFLVLIWKDLARSNFYRKKLEEAHKLAEKLLKVKEIFLANMSHEIRTPITSIIGFSEKLSDTRLNQSQGKYLQYINSSSEHLLRLVDDLLDFSRIESGKLNLETRPFFVAHLLKDIFETMAVRARQKGLDAVLELNIDPGLKVSGDDLRIRQIVLNLLNNSIKFTSTGSISLIAIANIDEGKAMLQISVQDTGIGIPLEKQQEIFNEFTQADASTTRKYGGSGLGLAISQKLARLMSGEIKLESTPGDGTIVQVILPIPVYTGEMNEILPLKNNSIPDLSELRILLAEDDETTRILISENLLATGAHVRETDNGQTAWESFLESEGDFDLMITDIQMPGLSGTELVKKITAWFASEQLEPCPILGLTAHSTPDDMRQYREDGFTDLLMKPFKQAGFYNMVAKLLDVEQLFKNSSIDEEEPGFPDLTVFKQFANNDPEALKRILSSLIAGLGETIESLKISYAEKNYANISLLAHRAQPNVRNLGDTQTANTLQVLERLRANKNPDKKSTGELINAVISGLEKLKETIQERVSNY